jgi:hypothetical protein
MFIFLLALTPLFYCGFRFAEIQDPRMVTTVTDEAPPAKSPAPTSSPARWVIARVFNGNYIAVRLLAAGETVDGCRDQYPLTSSDKKKKDVRPSRLSRDFRVVTGTDVTVTWNKFPEALNYCLFNDEKQQGWQDLSAGLFIRQGPSALSDAPAPPTAPPTPSPLPASAVQRTR